MDAWVRWRSFWITGVRKLQFINSWVLRLVYDGDSPGLWHPNVFALSVWSSVTSALQILLRLLSPQKLSLSLFLSPSYLSQYAHSFLRSVQNSNAAGRVNPPPLYYPQQLKHFILNAQHRTQARPLSQNRSPKHNP